MRRLIVLGFVLVLLGVADISARSFAASKLEDRAQQEAPPGSTVSASIGGFPFIPRLLLSGKVSHVGVHVEDVNATVITFSTVDLDLDGVKLDRDRLISDRKARVVGIERGTVSAVLTQQALSDALHVPITIAGGEVSVTILGKSIPVTPTVNANGRLSLTGTGLGQALSLTIPKTDYVPCIGDVTVLAARIRLSCEIHDVPPALLDATQR
jgi:hypothetical protein